MGLILIESLRFEILKPRNFILYNSALKSYRDVSTGMTGTTAVPPKFSNTLTLFQPWGQILSTIAEVAPQKFPCGYISEL